MLPTQPLPDSEIHIWCASLAQSPSTRTGYFNLLSADEITQAQRFHFEKDSSRYIISRGFLRRLLSSYTNIHPAELQFTYGAHGKPSLASKISGKKLEFNLSHSNQQVLFAFNWEQSIGVDIEFIKPMKDMDDFAWRFFTPNEYDLLRSLSKQKKQEFFFKIWTAKESYLKANGSGLTMPINEVEVKFTNEDIVKLFSIGNNQKAALHWQIELFSPTHGYQAAIAIENRKKKIVFQKT